MKTLTEQTGIYHMNDSEQHIFI